MTIEIPGDEKKQDDNVVEESETNTIDATSLIDSIANPPQAEIITPEVGAMYRVELNYNPNYSSYKCDSNNFDPVEEEDESFEEEEENSSWDGVEDYYDEYGYYGYNCNERENPCDKSYYYDKKIGMNVLATDLGVTIKRGLNKSYFVAVNDILNTNPVPGAKVTFYNFAYIIYLPVIIRYRLIALTWSLAITQMVL